MLTGAGIGIISTELGYYIADLLFKEKGIHHHDAPNTFSRQDKPSFLGVYFGANVPLSRYDLSETQEFRTSTGSLAGVEGAWFWNPYLGVGGRLTVSNTHIITTEGQAESVAEDDNFDALSAMAGLYVSYPLTARWNVGSKLLSGYAAYPRLELANGNTVPRKGGACFGSGLSVSYKIRKGYGIRFFLDYNLQPAHSHHTGEWMSTLAVGSTFGILF